MLHRALALLVTMAFLLPSFLVGIVTTGVLVLELLGIGPYEKSWAFLGLFSLLVPFGVFAFGLGGYALLVLVLRVTRLESWYEQHVPAGKPSLLDVPFGWVRSAVHRLVPSSTHEG